MRTAKIIKKYRLTIRLFEGTEGGELVFKTVHGTDPDDAIGQGFKIVDELLFNRLNPNLKAKITACREVGDADFTPV